MISLAPILISAAVSVIVAYVTARASGYSKDVVQERKQWRDRVRLLTITAAGLMRSGETQSPMFFDVYSEFCLRLNPDDEDDKAILDTLLSSMNQPDDMLRMKFLALSARLLKHDWERSKAESRFLGSFNAPNGPAIRLLRSSDYLDRGMKS